MHPARLIRHLFLLGVLAWLPALRAGSRDGWVEVKSPHFLAYTDAGEAEARKALKGFEGIRSVFNQVFPGIRVDPPRPTIVIVVENEAAMRRFLPNQFVGRDPKRPAGYFLSGPDRNYAVLRLDVDHQAGQPYFVVFHEYTHSIIHLNFTSLPLWLNEGIADFYGATEIKSDRVFLGRVPVGSLARLRSSVLLPFETLLAVTHDSPHYQEGQKTGIFYSQSWAFVHYLFMDEQARKKGLLMAYLKALGQTTDPIAAAREGFGDLEQLKRALGQYSRRSVFTFWDLPLAVKLTDKEFQSRPLSEAEALVVEAEFLQHSRQEAEARPLLVQALALGPKRPEVWTALGRGHHLRGELEEAQLAYETALAYGSQDFRTPYFLATLAQAKPDQGQSARILAWLETARALRPDFPGIHMALCRQYSWAPRDPTRALQAGREAVLQDPQVLSYRFNLGIACINLDLENDAKAIGGQLNLLAVSPEEKQMAASYAANLAEYLSRRKAPEVGRGAVSPETGGTTVSPRPSGPLKFSLPTHLAPLGGEVLQLVSAGKDAEAIRKVEKALAQAQTAYDRKVLRTLLTTLREAQGAKAPIAPLSATPESGSSTQPAQPGVKPLKFWLPDTLAVLSQEVQAAVMQGRLDEAIQMVKAAIPEAKGPYEKPSLKALLDHLKARKAGH